MDAFYASNRKLVYYTFLSQLTTYFGILATVFGLAFVVSITVEASFLNLEKLVFAPFYPRKNAIIFVNKHFTITMPYTI